MRKLKYFQKTGLDISSDLKKNPIHFIGFVLRVGTFLPCNAGAFAVIISL
jgi:hypothetical protein